MIHFEIGIIAYNSEERDALFNLFTNNYPYIKAIKSNYECLIEFPMMTVRFLCFGVTRGYRFDAVYCTEKVPEEIINEIIYPSVYAKNSLKIKDRVRPLSDLYRQFFKTGE